MDPQDLKLTGRRLFRERQYAAAVPLLQQATSFFPDDEQLWQEAILASSWTKQKALAVSLAKQAVDFHPQSGWLWRQLGADLMDLTRLDEAESALGKAFQIDNKSPWLWRYLAKLGSLQKSSEREMDALENLDSLGQANADDLNQLGLTYQRSSQLLKAIATYRRSIQMSPRPIPFYNLGVALMHPTISQDADAADAFRQALLLDPSFERAQKKLEILRQKLLPLAQRTLTEFSKHHTVANSHAYRFYINPIEALQLQDITSLAEITLKSVQRCKKHLLQEVELNDGKISWMENASLDKSRAIQLADELLIEENKTYHWAIFENKRLLRFLTHGQLEHFLYTDGDFPHQTLELIIKDPGFLNFLSRIFARQFDNVLSHAIECRSISIIESLFDGRRWVLPEDESHCIENSSKRIRNLVKLLEARTEQAKNRKLSLAEIQEFLQENRLVEIFSLLSSSFRQEQAQVVTHLRSIAITTWNEYEDPYLSNELLKLCRRFPINDASLNHQLEQDEKFIGELLAEEEEYAFTAVVKPGQQLRIRRGVLSFQGATVAAETIEGIRWGVFIEKVNGVKTHHSFTLGIRTGSSAVLIEWDLPGLLATMNSPSKTFSPESPISELQTPQQEIAFEKMIQAVMQNLFPIFIEKLVSKIQSGGLLRIGPCTVSSRGITFESGMFFSTEHTLLWNDVDTKLEDGQIVLYSRKQPTICLRLLAREIENAVVFPFLCAVLRSESPTSEKQSVPAAHLIESPFPLFEYFFKHRNMLRGNYGKMFLAAYGLMFVFSSLYQGLFSSEPPTPTVQQTVQTPSPTPTVALKPTPRPKKKTPREVSPAIENRPQDTDPRNSYLVPDYRTMELDRDKREIDDQKAITARYDAQVQRLKKEIDQQRYYLDRTNEYEVDNLNQKVGAYNSLVERARVQNAYVNQLVDAYNEKLRRYGRYAGRY